MTWRNNRNIIIKFKQNVNVGLGLANYHLRTHTHIHKHKTNISIINPLSSQKILISLQLFLNRGSLISLVQELFRFFYDLRLFSCGLTNNSVEALVLMRCDEGATQKISLDYRKVYAYKKKGYWSVGPLRRFTNQKRLLMSCLM